MKSLVAPLSLAALLVMPAAADPTIGLDGASGHIFKVDPAANSFELLKETEYDPKTNAGQSRFTVHWTDRTTITRIEERTSFAGIKGPLIADFHGIDDPKLLGEAVAAAVRKALDK